MLLGELASPRKAALPVAARAAAESLVVYAPPVGPDAATRERYRAVWSRGMTGPLNYYRASPLRPPTGPQDAIHAIEFADEAVTVRVPTTVLWGEADTALPASLLDGMQRWVPDLDLRRLPAATHWLVHEDPARVAATIDELTSRA